MNMTWQVALMCTCLWFLLIGALICAIDYRKQKERRRYQRFESRGGRHYHREFWK